MWPPSWSRSRHGSKNFHASVRYSTQRRTCNTPSRGSPTGPTRPCRCASKPGPRPGVRLDLLLSRPDLGTHLVLELKYLTSAWEGDVHGEHYELLSQGAQDIRAYDVVKNIARVERFVGDKPGWTGAVLVLTNEPSYWTRPGHGRATNADDFRIYEGNQLTGSRAWGARTGAGTMKGREAPIELRGNYTCTWTPYSTLPGNRGRFRLLAFTVTFTGWTPPQPADEPDWLPAATAC